VLHVGADKNMSVEIPTATLASGGGTLDAAFAGISLVALFWVLLVAALIPNVLALAAPSRSRLAIVAGIVGALLADVAAVLAAQYVLVVPGVVVAVLVARELQTAWGWLGVPIAILAAILLVWELPLDWLWMAAIAIAYIALVIVRRRRARDGGDEAGEALRRHKPTGP
jgi:hypothetical protein